MEFGGRVAVNFGPLSVRGSSQRQITSQPASFLDKACDETNKSALVHLRRSFSPVSGCDLLLSFEQLELERERESLALDGSRLRP